MSVRTAAAVVLIVLTVGACGAGAEPATPTVPPPTAGSAAPTSAAQPVPPELRVENPKDATVVPPCELLTEDQLIELGLLPGSGEPGSIRDYDGCGWQLADDRLNLASAGINQGLTLAEVYRVPERFDRLEPLADVAGHPAVRADINNDGSCFLVVALGGEQLLGTLGNIAGRSVPDPCALPRRMAELILSNLPPQS